MLKVFIVMSFDCTKLVITIGLLLMHGRTIPERGLTHHLTTSMWEAWGFLNITNTYVTGGNVTRV
jgi:hypothetical protein